MKGVPIITNLNDLSIRHLIKLILYENDVKLLKFKRPCIGRFVIYLKCEILIIDRLLIPEMNTSRKAMEWLICFSIVNLMLGCLLFNGRI